MPQKSTQTDEDKEKDIFFESDKDPKHKDLREQYQRLHSDFKNKVTEVAALRVDLEKTKTELDEITILHHELESMYQREIDQNNESSADKYQVWTLFITFSIFCNFYSKIKHIMKDRLIIYHCCWMYIEHTLWIID